MAQKKYLTPRQAATALGIRMDTTYALIWAGKLVAEKSDGRWRVPLSAVESRLKARERTNA